MDHILEVTVNVSLVKKLQIVELVTLLTQQNASLASLILSYPMTYVQSVRLLAWHVPKLTHQNAQVVLKVFFSIVVHAWHLNVLFSVKNVQVVQFVFNVKMVLYHEMVLVLLVCLDVLNAQYNLQDFASNVCKEPILTLIVANA